MTKSTSNSENNSDTLIKNKVKLVKAIKSIIDTNGFDYLKNKPYDVYLSLVANKSCSKKVAISVLSSLLAEVPSLLLKGRSKSIQKISSVLNENCCLSDTISGELASVYQEVFSDENKKSWEDNKNSGLDYFLEMELDISWEGDSTWECSQGSEDCHYSAEIKVAPLKDSLNTSLIDDLLKENPFITDEMKMISMIILITSFQIIVKVMIITHLTLKILKSNIMLASGVKRMVSNLYLQMAMDMKMILKLGLDVIRVKIFKRVLNSVRISNHRSSTVVLMYNSPSP